MLLTVSPLAAIPDPLVVKIDAGGGGDAFAPLIAPLLTPAEPATPGNPLPMAGEMLPTATLEVRGAPLLKAPSRFVLAAPGEPVIFTPPMRPVEPEHPVAPEPKAKTTLLTTSAFAGSSKRVIVAATLHLAEPGEPDVKKAEDTGAAPILTDPALVTAPQPPITATIPQPAQPVRHVGGEPTLPTVTAPSERIPRQPALAPESRLPPPSGGGVNVATIAARPITIASEEQVAEPRRSGTPAQGRSGVSVASPPADPPVPPPTVAPTTPHVVFAAPPQPVHETAPLLAPLATAPQPVLAGVAHLPTAAIISVQQAVNHPAAVPAPIAAEAVNVTPAAGPIMPAATTSAFLGAPIQVATTSDAVSAVPARANPAPLLAPVSTTTLAPLPQLTTPGAPPAPAAVVVPSTAAVLTQPIAPGPVVSPASPHPFVPLTPLRVQAPTPGKVAERADMPQAPVRPDIAPPAPVTGPLILPALQAFGAAIRRAIADERSPAAPAGDAPATIGLLATAAPASAGAQPVASSATLDTADRRWPHAMAQQIERLRDAAEETSTRIRLLPDALGPVDVAVRREGDTVHVHFAAREAETRQLLLDAQPRLAEAADARGLKLGRADVSAADAQAGDRQQRQPAAQPHQTTRQPTRAQAAAATESDTRIA